MSEWISKYWDLDQTLQWKIIYTTVVIVFFLLVRYVAERWMFRNLKELKDRYYYTRAIKITIGIISVITVAYIWFSQLGSLGTFVGLISAGLAIALKDLVVNLAGWFFILARRPFTVGDRVEIGDFKGDVIDIRMFQFSINEIGNWVDADQSTGRIIHIPNGKVFVEPQANFTQSFSFIWNEIDVLLTFESDWEKAKMLLDEIVNRHAAHISKSAEKKLIEASKKYMILYNKLTPIVYTTVKDSGIKLSMRYLITPRRRRTSEQAIWEEVLTVFAKHPDIDFAYPTQRIYYKPAEGHNQPFAPGTDLNQKKQKE